MLPSPGFIISHRILKPSYNHPPKPHDLAGGALNRSNELSYSAEAISQSETPLGRMANFVNGMKSSEGSWSEPEDYNKAQRRHKGADGKDEPL